MSHISSLVSKLIGPLPLCAQGLLTSMRIIKYSFLHLRLQKDVQATQNLLEQNLNTACEAMT